MIVYDLTLRFDNEDHSLTQTNGLDISEISEILSKLAKATGNDDKLVLSEIKGNCYALRLSTSNAGEFEVLKAIHKPIENNVYDDLNSYQLDYIQTLQKVLKKNKFNFQAYDKDKKFNIETNEIIINEAPKYYYEIGTIIGVVTSIGGKNMDVTSYIHLSTQSYDIKISNDLERQLIPYFKQRKIRLTLKKKIQFDTDKVIGGEAISFEVIDKSTFAELSHEIKVKYPDGLFDEIHY
jgi:hypothetical protein